MCPQMVGRLSVTLFATKGSVGYLWKVTHARPTDETGSLVQYQLNSQDVLFSMESQKISCNECGASFTNNQNRLRHVRTLHQGKKRTDNEKRKREVTDKAGKQGILACTYSGICEDSVESNPQAELKSPAEYVRMAMKAHKEDRQLTSEEFMQATGLSVFKLITDTFWTALYERPDLYVYVTEEMVSWLGFEGESRTQKLHMLRTLNARSIAYTYLNIDDLKNVADQVLEIPTEVYDRPQNYKHLLMRPLDFQVLVAGIQTKRGKEVATELVKLGFVVHCYREYEKQALQVEKQALQGKNEVLQQEKQSLEGQKKVLKHENTSLLKCKADLTTDPLKDLTLKMVMWDEEKFTVIRAQKSHAEAYMKKYMRQFRGPKNIVDFKQHPNPMSKWAKMRKLLVDENKIEKLEGNTFKCINGYNLAELLKELKIEHKGQCVMEATRTIDSYLKQKPVLHPAALMEHNYCS